MRRYSLLSAMAGLVVIVLVYAWVDGGREPLRTISQPVPVPEMPR